MMSGRSSVVVLSVRPGDWLGRCLASVVDQADEVVLVDNGSAGRTASAIGREAGVRVVRSESNLGFSGGVNLGARHATGDLLALLNDDAEAGPGWLRAASAALEDPSVAAVSPKVLLAGRWREVVLDDEEWFSPGDDRALGRRLTSVTAAGRDVLSSMLGPGLHRIEQDEHGNRWRWSSGRRPFYVPLDEPGDATPGSDDVRIDGEPAPPGPVCRLFNNAGTYLRTDGYAGDIGIGAPDDGRFDQARERFALSGTAMVTTAATWARLGGLAGSFFAYYEDIDWCWRARRLGLRLVYDPAATVTHRRSATSGGETAPRVRVLAERNRTLAMVRNAPRAQMTAALRQRLADGPDGGVRREVLRGLPAALAGRVLARRSQTCTPHEVWDGWAGRDVTWDDGPWRAPS
jgi:GT2 family glycosyltransferase